ncbi:MAG: DNA-binding protein WhiA [Firmicutes bacterium]|nr:DNA-binding protein WhiA [Bacillota bacterium]
MTAAKEAKEELTKTPDTDCCKAAFLSAVIHTAGLISFGGGMSVVIESVNPLLGGMVEEITRALFTGEAGRGGRVESGEWRAESRVKMRGQERGKAIESKEVDGKRPEAVGNTKSNLTLTPLSTPHSPLFHGGSVVIKGDFIADMLVELRILKLRDGLNVVAGIDPYLVENECCKRAYLAGAFVGSGALVTNRGYHLEFACASKKLRDGLVKLLEGFEIRAAVITKGDKHLAYIKDKDAISDVLALMGAYKSVLRLNSLAAERSLSREVSRKANCDIANLNRLVAASLKQREAIASLGTIADKRLRETAEARLNNPELSYGELAALLGISRGALKYRLERLVALAAAYNS